LRFDCQHHHVRILDGCGVVGLGADRVALAELIDARAALGPEATIDADETTF
jgi:hypothetical protein